MRNGSAVAIGAVLLALCAPAEAAPLTENYVFDLSNFINYDGRDPAPVGDVSGSVTVTFDPTRTVINQTSGITLNSLSGITLGSAISFDVVVVPTGTLLYFGGLQNGPGDIENSTNDLVVALDVTDPGAPVLLLCNSPYEACGNVPGSTTGSGYAVSTLPDQYGARTASIAVPEPTSLALLGTGLVGLMLRRRRRAG